MPRLDCPSVSAETPSPKLKAAHIVLIKPLYSDRTYLETLTRTLVDIPEESTLDLGL